MRFLTQLIKWFFLFFANSQETGTDISQQIFNGCGKPQLNPKRRRRAANPRLFVAEKRYFDDIGVNGRVADDALDNFSFDDDVPVAGQYVLGKRSTPLDRYRRDTSTDHTDHTDTLTNSREVYVDQMQFDAASDEDNHGSNRGGGRRKNKNNNRNGNGNGGNGDLNTPSRTRVYEDDTDQREPPLDRLIRDIRAKVKDSKKFWSNLPYQICNNEEIAASPSNDVNCWNGKEIDR